MTTWPRKWKGHEFSWKTDFKEDHELLKQEKIYIQENKDSKRQVNDLKKKLKVKTALKEKCELEKKEINDPVQINRALEENSANVLEK